MAVPGPRTRDGGEAGHGTDSALVRVCDPAGRPRGTGFAIDHRGTLITSHEAVDGLARLVLHTADGRVCVLDADAVTPLPYADLALLRTEGLGLDPLPVTARDRIEAGTYVRIAAGGWREARVLDTTAATYRATDCSRLVEDTLELALGTAGTEALRPGGGAAGGPVLDAATGAVLAVLGTRLHTDQRATGFAVPLRGLGQPLDELLDRNARTVPAHGEDLNLAGVLHLTARAAGTGVPPDGRLTVRRTRLVEEFTAFERSERAVLALVGAPGSGRTTELAALAAQCARDPEPIPVLRLRGADLRDTDPSLAAAVARALHRNGGGGHPLVEGEPGGVLPEHLARVARDAGRPLLLLLDGPEEMPHGLARGLPEWTRETAAWLCVTGARLVTACGPEHWERAGTLFPQELLYGGRAGERGAHRSAPGESHPGPVPDRLPPCVALGDLTPAEAHEARARHGIPEGLLQDPDARHPLTLRLLGEVRAALPDTTGGPDLSCVPGAEDLSCVPGAEDLSRVPMVPCAPPVDRDDVFSAYLDLVCLRIAVRLAAENGLHGTAVRRLAAKVSGQVHDAARRSLGPGQGALDPAAFETVFPWGPAPGRRLGNTAGWACAVLAEGLIQPAGLGYRFAHEELADWLQGRHLDLDAALHTLVHRSVPGTGEHPVSSLAATAAARRRARPFHRPAVVSRTQPVPRHRSGPVVEALLHLARREGPAGLALRLEDLVHAVDALLEPRPTPPDDDALWWAAHLLTDTLVRLTDARPYLHVLRLLADRIVRWRAKGRPVPRAFAPWFWTALPVPEAERLDLLRRLVTADEPPGRSRRPRPARGAGHRQPDGSGDTAPPRYLDAVARLLATDPVAVQRQLTRWFDDERPLPATPHATVATAAQALLHTHRHRAPDDLPEALADSAHPRGDELLAVLAEEEPSAVCRAVGRWARDERPARRVAAMAYGLRAAPYTRTEADHELLRHAAFTVLARPADCAVHGGALALLVRDPRTRTRHLPGALARFAAGDPQLPPDALVTVLATHPEPVLTAFRTRLRHSGPDTGETLRALADATTPALAHQVAALIREAAAQGPQEASTAGPGASLAEQAAAQVGRRLDHGPAAPAVLLPLVAGLLDGSPGLRSALAVVLGAPGAEESRPLRHELLDLLLTRERDPAVLDALLRAAAYGAQDGGETHARVVIHRAGLLLARTQEGTARLDRGLLDLARRVPGFAQLLARWLAEAPAEWAAVVGPGTRRMIEGLAAVRVPA
ncbi:trypsin-like peptidase domain-containing protein [Streptomyces gibsoniae]|uniref:Trypsin-like peptidase domain-containing protein n=1 Tax=Streptomyces gibsoniae TaxID=3075529 RepID=A0ABU2TXQ2_9ACTN|nr:trypsin-like peptidase domain-containing protein [Streptomyces sp. DSM 41699]MDT0465737.1 trypsin-like peptidase domain-containing protein [Streptomyces sp. DSM 41699]